MKITIDISEIAKKMNLTEEAVLGYIAPEAVCEHGKPPMNEEQILQNHTSSVGEHFVGNNVRHMARFNSEMHE